MPTIHPDPDATGSPGGLTTKYTKDTQALQGARRETQERDAAYKRGRARRQAGDAGHDPEIGRADPELVRRSFAALAENTRDYAIFLMDRDGIIRFWGQGGHLMKRWTREEAEGSHLRLLYPDGGSEDGTAEDHLAESAEAGEFVGEGHRTRSDGTTFWARVTLTALKDDEGTLLGFAKVTIDLSLQRAGDAARARARGQIDAAEARQDQANLGAVVEMLKEEVAALQKELEARDRGED
jgi:PAS domain S-box-containing protein